MKSGKNKLILFSILLALAALFLGSCASTENKAYSAFTLSGMAYDRSGSAVNGMEINMGSGQTVKTDYSGRFSFPDVKAGNYDLKAMMDGYETFSGNIRVSSPADIVYISMYSLSDLLRAAKDSMREGEWATASSYLERALAVEKNDSRALYLKALALSSRQNPARDLAAASLILSSMIASGVNDPSVKRLLSDIEKESAAP
jgi:hypothetical protein